MGSNKIRYVMFMTSQFPFKYSWFVSTACGKWCLGTNHNRPASGPRQDGYSIGQDGKYVKP